MMHWTIDDLWRLPLEYYDVLVEEVNTGALRHDGLGH